CRTHQLCCVSLDLTQISTRVSMLDSDIAVLGPAERLETLAKCNDPSQHFGIVLGVGMQECDAPHALALLRVRRERPRGSRRAAEQRYELPPSHVGHHAASPLPGPSRSTPRSTCRTEADKSLVRGLKCSESLRALPACPTIPRRPYRGEISPAISTCPVRPKRGHSVKCSRL